MSRIPDYMQPVDMALRDAITRPSPRERLIAEHDAFDANSDWRNFRAWRDWVHSNSKPPRR